MKSSYLQGISWHTEQMKRTCQDGSTYCLYNKNICTCKASIHHYKKCVGKGICEEFESKGNTAKISSAYTYSMHERKKQIIHRQEKMNTMNEENVIDSDEIIASLPGESAEDKFKRVSKYRVDKTVNCIRTISNLSNKNTYFYTDVQIVKMFDHLQKALDKAKKSFTQEEFMEDFKWDDK